MSQQNPALKDINGIENSLIASTLSSKQQVINLNLNCSPRLDDFKIFLKAFFLASRFLEDPKPLA